mgnify:FL=1|jgi:hypothetical protein|tara:strand:+ start:336 stop:1463 length:1128 start_codon:yes stop_codon:yes gene_type:complete
MAKKRLIKQKDKSVNHSMFHVGGGKATGAKIKSWANLRGTLKHSLRIAGAENVDPAHTDKNITMFDIEVPEEPEGATKALKERFESITEGLDKTAKNGQKKVVCEDLLFTTSPLWWNRDENGNYLHDDKENKEKLAEWVKWHERYIDQNFGKENVVYANVQLDETTPHISCQVVPIRTDKNGKRHISHSHFFDGKVETPSGAKINKMAYKVGLYQQEINKAFKTLTPSIKAKSNKEKKTYHFPKQQEIKKQRKSVKEWYGDKDKSNKENKKLTEKIKDMLWKIKGLDFEIMLKEETAEDFDRVIEKKKNDYERFIKPIVEDMREIKKLWNECNLEEMSIKQEEVKKKMNDLPENIAEKYDKYLPGKKKKKQKNKQ